MIAEVLCKHLICAICYGAALKVSFQPDKWDHSLGSKGCGGQGMSHELVQGSFKQDTAMCFSQRL